MRFRALYWVVILPVIVGLFANCATSVSKKNAYKGRLDVAQRVDPKAIEKYRTIVLKVESKNSEFTRFVQPIQQTLIAGLPQKTRFSKIVLQNSSEKLPSSSEALALILEPYEYSGGGVIQVGWVIEGLKLRVSLTDMNGSKTYGKSEMVSAKKGDETRVGLGKVSVKTSGSSPEEQIVAQHTLMLVTDFLNGEN